MLTNDGDTVASLPAGSNRGIEAALDRGRRVEAIIVSDGEQAGVDQRLNSSCSAAFKSGRFQASSRG